MFHSRLGRVGLSIGIVAAIGLLAVAAAPSAQISGSEPPQLAARAAREWGDAVAGLRMGISSAIAPREGRKEPEFAVTIENIGSDDVVLRLGTMLANGKVMWPDAVRLFVTDTRGSIEELTYFDRRYPGIAGRTDDFIVSMRAGSAYSLRLTLERLWSRAKTEPAKLADGQYRVEARFDRQGAVSLNLDTPGIRLLNFWKGTLKSNAITIEIR